MFTTLTIVLCGLILCICFLLHHLVQLLIRKKQLTIFLSFSFSLSLLLQRWEGGRTTCRSTLASNDDEKHAHARVHTPNHFGLPLWFILLVQQTSINSSNRFVFTRSKISQILAMHCLLSFLIRWCPQSCKIRVCDFLFSCFLQI